MDILRGLSRGELELEADTAGRRVLGKYDLCQVDHKAVRFLIEYPLIVQAGTRAVEIVTIAGLEIDAQAEHLLDVVDIQCWCRCRCRCRRQCRFRVVTEDRCNTCSFSH